MMNSDLLWTPLFQALHLLGLLIWLGPSLGGYYILLAARRSGDPKLAAWVRRRWQTILNVEHLGVALVLASGLARAAALGWLTHMPAWLALKLLLVGLVVLPIEVADILVANALVKPALAHEGGAPDLARRLAWQDRLAALSIPPLALALFGIVYFVVWKPVW
jgi:hypothetical protein